MSGTVDLIAKLHRKAISAQQIGNDDEASAFDEKVAELLERCDLTLEEVLADVSEGDGVEPIMLDPSEYGDEPRRGRADVWMLILAAVVARAHDCEMLAAVEVNRIGFVGERAVRDRAVALFCRLVPKLGELSERAREAQTQVMVDGFSFTSSATTSSGVYYVTNSGSVRDEQWRTSWLIGVVETIGRRLAADHEDSPEGHGSAETAPGSGSAVARMGQRRAQDWLEEQEAEQLQTEPIEVRKDGYRSGVDAGWSVDLDTEALPAKTA